MSDDAAREEAERRFLVVVPDLAYLRGAFVAGAAWQAAQPVVVSAEQMEAAAQRMAILDDYDGCFLRIAEWEATPDDEKRDDEYPSDDYESARWWRRHARAALGITVEPTP